MPLSYLSSYVAVCGNEPPPLMSDELKDVTSVLSSLFGLNEMYGGFNLTVSAARCGMFTLRKCAISSPECYPICLPVLSLHDTLIFRYHYDININVKNLSFIVVL